MTIANPEHIDAVMVWRYMSFSRFVWMLQKKQLWLSRADLLGDPWEITLAGDQLDHMISYAPPVNILDLPEVMETEMQYAERIIKLWRRQTFVSCWSASNHESHALWRIYCPSAEGVAVQTTLATLRKSTGDIPVYRVTYETPGSNQRTPTLPDLVTKKRPMFRYEQEVRVVDWKEDALPEMETLGRGLDWDPEKHLESIRLHPEADASLMETVRSVVDHYAPALSEHLAWSEMIARPPF